MKSLQYEILAFARKMRYERELAQIHFTVFELALFSVVLFSVEFNNYLMHH